MKKRIFPFVQIILMLILISIPAVMVFFYRSEFENYEIGEIDSHLTVIQNHARLFCEKYGEDESRFIKEMSSYMSQHSAFGSMIILDEGYEIVLPEDQPSREARGALAEEFAGAIQHGTLQNQSYFDTEDGLSLRVSFSSLQGKDAGKLYVIAYYDTDKSSSQIDRLESIYLQIAVFSFIFFFAVAVLFYWDHSRTMRLLSEEILRMGTENFAPVAVPPSVGATERVRRAVNTAMKQLSLSISRRETITRAVNHFIRNRLMAVDGYAQGIETGVFSPEEAAARIRTENFAMEELLHNISVSSYMKEQTMPGNDEILRLSDEIEESFSKYRYIADRKNVALSLLPCDRETTVKGTKSLIETVLDNLISNAVRYAASQVTVSVEEAGDQIAVRVRDDGKGLSDKDMHSLFRPMYKGQKGNMGIGLSVAMAAARYMGGSLSAENSPEGGAVFTFTMPAL